jgi:hypothetical protein
VLTVKATPYSLSVSRFELISSKMGNNHYLTITIPYKHFFFLNELSNSTVTRLEVDYFLAWGKQYARNLLSKKSKLKNTPLKTNTFSNDLFRLRHFKSFDSNLLQLKNLMKKVYLIQFPIKTSY